MPRLSHLRWHLALAIGGALVIEWLHWQIATGLIAILAIDRVVMMVVQRARHNPQQAGTDAGPTRAPSGRTTARLPLALKRALGVDCPSCRGFGCVACAYSGLGR